MKVKRLVQFTVLVGLILVPSLEVESFHDPMGTRVFPQLVVGQIGDFSYFPVLRACTPGSFQGQIAIFQGDRSVPTNLLINGQPYGGPIQLDLGPNECVTYEMAVGDEARASLQGFASDIIGFLIFEALGGVPFVKPALPSAVPTGVSSELSDVSFSFFYNIRDSEDRLVDSVAVPPSTAGRGFRFITSRGGGFDVGVAAFVTTPNSAVNVTVHLPEQDSGSSVVQGNNTLTGTVQIPGQRAFFLHEVISGFPETVSAALVEVELAGSGEIYGVALGVQAENGNAQLSGQPVNVIPLQ